MRKPAPGSVTNSELAKLLHVSRPYISKLLSLGVLVRGKDGYLNKDDCIARLAARRQPARLVNRELTEANSEGPELTANSERLSTVMLRSRIKTEVERGKLAELDRREREGELCERRLVADAAFAQGRVLRDSMFNIIPRIASQLAAESSPTGIAEILDDAIREALIELVDGEGKTQ